MESNKQLVEDIKAQKSVLVDILSKAVDTISEKLEDSNVASRESFKEYCSNQASIDEQKQLMRDLQESNSDALDAYYDERVKEDESYMSCSDVDNDYVRCDDITVDWLNDNMGTSFMEDLVDEYLSNMYVNEFVELVINHTYNSSRARAIVKELIDEYM